MYLNHAKKALKKAQRVTPAMPGSYGFYSARGYKKNEKGRYELHCTCEGACLLDSPVQAAMRQNHALAQCEQVRIACW